MTTAAKAGSRLRKGCILNKWETSDHAEGDDKFNREMQVHLALINL